MDFHCCKFIISHLMFAALKGRSINEDCCSLWWKFINISREMCGKDREKSPYISYKVKKEALRKIMHMHI